MILRCIDSIHYSMCSGFDEDTATKTLDYIERYVMTCLYRAVFCAPIANDEESDLLIQEKIRSLNWINAYTLDAGIDESMPAVTSLVDQAITGTVSSVVCVPTFIPGCPRTTEVTLKSVDNHCLTGYSNYPLPSNFLSSCDVTVCCDCADIIEMDGKRAPQDKLASIVQCSKHIFEALNATKQATASADEFLPALIYIILKVRNWGQGH